MRFQLTPTLMENTYDYLCKTPPFSRWKLPEADDVEFHVTQSLVFGDHYMVGDQHVLRMSTRRTGCSNILILTMAHEMVHVSLGWSEKAEHGKEFRRRAKQVCDFHGFDLKSF